MTEGFVPFERRPAVPVAYVRVSWAGWDVSTDAVLPYPPTSTTAHRGGHQNRTGITDIPTPELMYSVVSPRAFGAANSKRPMS